MTSGLLPSDPRPGPQGGLAEPATARQPAPSSAELELLRQHSIRVLGSVADALEKAAHHRQSLLAEIQVAEQTLLGLVSEREQVATDVATMSAQLSEAATQLQLAQDQRLRIVREVEQLLSAGLMARAAVQQEVANLEHRRDAPAAQLAHPVLVAQPAAIQPTDTAHAALVARAADMDSAASVVLPDAKIAESSMAALRDVEVTTATAPPPGAATGIVEGSGVPSVASRAELESSLTAQGAADTPLANVGEHRIATALQAPAEFRSNSTPSAEQATAMPATELSSMAKAARADALMAELTALLGTSAAPGHAETGSRVHLAPQQHPTVSPLMADAVQRARRWRSTGSDALRATSRRLNVLLHPGLPKLSQIALGLVVAPLFGLAVMLTPLAQVFGGLQVLAVTSGSMEPSIPVGGAVGIRPVPVTDLKVGDAITFAGQTTPDVLVTHRVVGIEVRDGQTLLTTKGDANDAQDALSAPANRAVGRVEFALPWLGFLMVWLGSPVAKISIIALAVLALGLNSVKRSKPPTIPLPSAADMELYRHPRAPSVGEAGTSR